MLSRIFALAGAAAYVHSTSIIHETRDDLQSTWTKHTRLDPDDVLPVRIGLKQNQDALGKADDWLMETSDPASKNFGQHWYVTPSADE